MPTDRRYYVDGFVVYREFGIENPITGEWDITRDEQECHTEEQAKQTVEATKLEFPDDKVYYEAARILD